MRYRIQNLPHWLDEDDDALLRRAAERLSLGPVRRCATWWCCAARSTRARRGTPAGW